MSQATPVACADAPAVFSDAWLRRFDTPGPRYTSYPTADRFNAGFGPGDLQRALAARHTGPHAHGQRTPGASPAQALSVYVHVPFCESVCYYCGCNKVITKHHGRAAEYLDALDIEIALVRGELGRQGAAPAVSQLHFGGGSPTFLSDDELERVVASLRGALAFGSGGEAGGAMEMSIEVDPRTVTAGRLAHLRELGFNRISFGVQDFDPQVQEAVHRVQPFESVRDLIQSARSLGFASINADLIYGLPRQTPESFARTVGQMGELQPDRIALYAYAHLPERFKPQRRIAAAELPTAAQRVAMLGGAIAGFVGRGYSYIGMDHFALQGDSLAVARREGRLHRNFQGYTTQPDCDLIGLGVSSIGRVGGSYYQNAKTLPEYYHALSARRLPVERGLTMTGEDRLRHDAIMALMCQGRLEFGPVERAHGIRMREHFAAELARLVPMEEAGLVVLEADAVQVTAAGWYLVRAVAMVFDAYVLGAPAQQGYSRVV